MNENNLVQIEHYSFHQNIQLHLVFKCDIINLKSINFVYFCNYGKRIYVKET